MRTRILQEQEAYPLEIDHTVISALPRPKESDLRMQTERFVVVVSLNSRSGIGGGDGNLVRRYVAGRPCNAIHPKGEVVSVPFIERREQGELT